MFHLTRYSCELVRGLHEGCEARRSEDSPKLMLLGNKSNWTARLLVKTLRSGPLFDVHLVDSTLMHSDQQVDVEDEVEIAFGTFHGSSGGLPPC